MSIDNDHFQARLGRLVQAWKVCMLQAAISLGRCCNTNAPARSSEAERNVTCSRI